MAIDDALHMLAADYWEPVWLGLTPGQRSELVRVAGDLVRAQPDEDAFYAAVLGVLDVLRRGLAEDHPVLEAADQTYRWAAAPPVDWRPVITGLSGRLAVAARDLAVAARDEVRERLRQSPAMTADQVKSAGSDPYLIRLESGSGDFRFPLFQFDPAGHPIRTVLAVNERLGADDDPWGVADWWLGDNAWLNAVPADLLGSRDDLLLAAADAVARPDW